VGVVKKYWWLFPLGVVAGALGIVANAVVLMYSGSACSVSNPFTLTCIGMGLLYITGVGAFIFSEGALIRLATLTDNTRELAIIGIIAVAYLLAYFLSYIPYIHPLPYNQFT
jgi:hypothetical protein